MTKVDSANFKIDFEKLLKKYNLKDVVYSLNVQSNNQKGGQTAFIINNNYYSDSNKIFVIDNLQLADFPTYEDKQLYLYRYVSFKKLTTISGQKLPDFIKPPSIMIHAPEGKITVDEITKDGMRMFPTTWPGVLSEIPKSEKDDPRNLKFSLWITEKRN